MENRTLMGVLAYLGPLVIVPYVSAKDDPFVKFHIKQGIVLLVIEIVLWLATSMFYALYSISGLLQLVVLIYAVWGIVNVVQKKEKELPFIGSFAKQIKI